MRFEKEIEVINKLPTLSEKLKYYNDNVTPLFTIGIEQHKVGFDLGKEAYNIFCVCEQHKGFYTNSDFETYRDIRNNETQKVFDFFENTEDYKTKIEYYFKICEGYSTTKRTLYFIPDKIEEIDNRLFPYKEKIIDITPKNNNEIEILKNNIKEKLLLDVKNFYLPLAQFTFEKRAEILNNYLTIRTEKKRREELIQTEYDKINLSKIEINSKKPYDRMLFNILNTVENSIQGKHVEHYTEFSKIKITILAEDTIKYEKYLNSLCNNSEYIENSNDNKLSPNLTKANHFEGIEITNNIQKKDYPVINNAWEINNELIESIRLQYSTSKLTFGCKEDDLEIVPKIQSHDYLTNNFPIDDTIIKFYYAPTRLFITDADFEKMTKSGYIGNIERTLTPYPLKIFGAFHSRKKIHSQLSFLVFDKIYFINDKEVNFFSDLIPYFIDYSNGFKVGFNDFEKNCITPFLNEYSDKNDYTYKVFEYVTKNIAFQHSWLNNSGSFNIEPNENNEKCIVNAFEDGELQGYFYKAWSIILGNSKVYSTYFKEYYSKEKLENTENLFLSENDKIVKNEITSIIETNSLILHDDNLKDADGFPVNKEGRQICLVYKNGDIVIPLRSNFLISIKDNSCIVFNPNDKLKVNSAVDALINYLTYDFYENIEGYFLLDLSEEAKKRKRLRTKEPLKILKIQMYFDWITKWLNYLGNAFNFEFKLLFYAKYKEKIKMDVLSLETGLKVLKAPKNHIDFTIRWIEETDKNIELEAKAKNKSNITTNQAPDFTTKKKPQLIENISTEIVILKHSHIFKANAFEVWQYMFDEFNINEKSRTDVKFIFEEMRKEGEGLIHKTVNQKTFLEWITSTYDGLIIEKTSNHSRTKSRLQTYTRAKKLYKE